MAGVYLNRYVPLHACTASKSLSRCWCLLGLAANTDLMCLLAANRQQHFSRLCTETGPSHQYCGVWAAARLPGWPSTTIDLHTDHPMTNCGHIHSPECVVQSSCIQPQLHRHIRYTHKTLARQTTSTTATTNTAASVNSRRSDAAWQHHLAWQQSAGVVWHSWVNNHNHLGMAQRSAGLAGHSLSEILSEYPPPHT
jgi:hypothetical protein